MTLSSGSLTPPVSFAISGPPSGVNLTFSGATGTGTIGTLTVIVSTVAPLGTFPITVTATGGNGSASGVLSVTITQPQTPNFTLSASPASLTINRGASGTSTITITRSGGFTGAVTLGASGLPSGVTASFNPASATGTSAVLTLTASSAATLGAATVTVTGTSGMLTQTTPVSLTVNGGGGGTGGVTVTPVIASNGPWFNEQALRLDNTGAITSLSISIVIQRTTGVGFSGQYNTVGGQILQSNSVAPATITYQFNLATGQTLGPGSNRLFVAQMSGAGTVHPTSGDTYTVTYTTGGVTFTQTGTF
jgi:endoglucanase